MKESIIEEIRTAFKGITLGSGIGLYHAYELDDNWCAEANEIDEKHNWENISSKNLNDYGDRAQSFLDGLGMHFHLPAYMIQTLNNHHYDDIFFHICSEQVERSWLGLINSSQKQAIINFLEYSLSQNDFEGHYEIIQSGINSIRMRVQIRT